ncbi:UDP-N-acetylmuramoyl-tripeptide--D-alanyl-D-alanine ligase [Patescibacteria group bacterium]
MKKFIQKLIAKKAKKILAEHQPTIVAITGSVGKTSARNAIAAVLDQKYRVRTNIENYNNEFGVPLTIIGAKSPGKSVIGWLKILFKKQPKDYPNMLVLEYGADHPGDILYLCDLAKPEVGVLTAISPVHAENFGTIEKLTEEKAIVVEQAMSLVVLNADESRVMEVKEKAKAQVITCGFSDKAQVRAENFRLETREDFSFEPGEQFSEIHFDVVLSDHNQSGEIVLVNHLGQTSVNAALCAISIGLYFNLSLDEINQGLQGFIPQAGRMRPIPGIKGSLILDDSYNAAPASMQAALRVLEQFEVTEKSKRIAALGAMGELGQYSVDEHQRLGAQVAKQGIDLLVTVGEPAQDIDRGAKAAGMNENQIIHFATSQEAGRYLDREIKKGDVVVVKGSQSMRMEKVVKDLMAEPMKAGGLLVRQYGKWLEE